MPIYSRDESYSTEDNPVELLVKCDSDAGCASLSFSLDDWGDFDEGRYGHTLDICLTPMVEPFGWRDRIKLAWEILTKGRFKYRDDIVLDRQSVELLGEKLIEISKKMPVVGE